MTEQGIGGETEFRMSAILPEDFEGRSSLIERFKDDPVRAIKSYRELERMVSSTHRVPPKDAPPEEWKNFHRVMGVPDSPDGYSIPEELSGTVRSVFDNMRKEALEAGVTSAAWDRMSKAAAELAKKKAEEQENAKKEQLSKLVQEVGDAQSAAEESKRLAEKIGGKELSEEIEKAGLTESAPFLKIMKKVQEIVSEDQIVSGIGGSAADRGELAEARELAKKGQEILRSGIMENRRDPKFHEKFNEYMSIISKLSELGYDGVTDARLADQNPFMI